MARGSLNLTVQDGKVEIPDGPGWGVEINPDRLPKTKYATSEKAA